MSGPSGNREMEVVDLTTSKVKARVYAPAIDTKVYQITMEKSRLPGHKERCGLICTPRVHSIGPSVQQ